MSENDELDMSAWDNSGFTKAPIPIDETREQYLTRWDEASPFAMETRVVEVRPPGDANGVEFSPVIVGPTSLIAGQERKLLKTGSLYGVKTLDASYLASDNIISKIVTAVKERGLDEHWTKAILGADVMVKYKGKIPNKNHGGVMGDFEVEIRFASDRDEPKKAKTRSKK